MKLKFSLILIVFFLFILSNATAYAQTGLPENMGDEITWVEPGNLPDAWTYGQWESDENGVHMVKPGTNKHAFWVPQPYHFKNGFLRANIKTGKAVDATFFFRASVPSENRLTDISGYGLSIEDKKLIPQRWDNGQPRQMASEIELKNMPKSIEIVVYAIGSQMMIHVYNGETLVLLHSFILSDSVYMQGGIAWRAYRKQSRDTSLYSVSVIPGEKLGEEKESPVGVARYLWVKAETLPKKLPSNCSYIDPEFEENVAVLKCTRRDYEVLRRSGVDIQKVSGDYRQSFADKNFRAMKKKWPIRDASGYDAQASAKDADMVDALLKAYAELYPNLAQLVEVGKTHFGRTIYGLIITNRDIPSENKAPVLINGAHHGMELMATDFAVDAIEHLLENYKTDPETRKWVNGLEIWVVPLVNPDGNMLHFHESTKMGRKNGRDVFLNGVLQMGSGVDINRNYPYMWGSFGEKASSSHLKHYWYRGPYPGSEPEIQAMMTLVNMVQFASSISYHTVSTKILVPYSIDTLQNPQPDEAWPIAEEMALNSGKQSNGKNYSVVKNLYNVDGTDQDWFRAACGTTAFLVEGAQHNPTGQALRLDTIEKNRETWKTLLRRTLKGPSVYGFVKDQNGDPLVAQVEIEEVKVFQNEKWHTRCSDGRFERLLPGEGSYTVKVSLPDGTVDRKKVHVSGRKRVDFTVNRPQDYSISSILCENPDFCSVHTLCRTQQNLCPELAPHSHCYIGNACYPAGEVHGILMCNPVEHPKTWVSAF